MNSKSNKLALMWMKKNLMVWHIGKYESFNLLTSSYAADRSIRSPLSPGRTGGYGYEQPKPTRLFIIHFIHFYLTYNDVKMKLVLNFKKIFDHLLSFLRFLCFRIRK